MLDDCPPWEGSSVRYLVSYDGNKMGDMRVIWPVSDVIALVDKLDGCQDKMARMYLAEALRQVLGMPESRDG